MRVVHLNDFFKLCNTLKIGEIVHIRVFPRPFTHGGDRCGGQSVNGEGLMRGDIDLFVGT